MKKIIISVAKKGVKIAVKEYKKNPDRYNKILVSVISEKVFKKLFEKFKNKKPKNKKTKKKE